MIVESEMVENASSSATSGRKYLLEQQFDDILGVIDERIAKQEEAVRSMRAALKAEELALERLRLAREPLAGNALTESSRDVVLASVQGRNNSAKRPASQVILELAREAIAVASKPLTRRDIVNALEASGKAPVSRDLPSLVSKVLWKNSETFEQSGGGYWLKGRPIPDDGRPT
jgi:hypothetical protein